MRAAAGFRVPSSPGRSSAPFTHLVRQGPQPQGPRTSLLSPHSYLGHLVHDWRSCHSRSRLHPYLLSDPSPSGRLSPWPRGPTEDKSLKWTFCRGPTVLAAAVILAPAPQPAFMLASPWLCPPQSHLYSLRAPAVLPPPRWIPYRVNSGTSPPHPLAHRDSSAETRSPPPHPHNCPGLKDTHRQALPLGRLPGSPLGWLAPQQHAGRFVLRIHPGTAGCWPALW